MAWGCSPSSPEQLSRPDANSAIATESEHPLEADGLKPLSQAQAIPSCALQEQRQSHETTPQIPDAQHQSEQQLDEPKKPPQKADKRQEGSPGIHLSGEEPKHEMQLQAPEPNRQIPQTPPQQLAPQPRLSETEKAHQATQQQHRQQQTQQHTQQIQLHHPVNSCSHPQSSPSPSCPPELDDRGPLELVVGSVPSSLPNATADVADCCRATIADLRQALLLQHAKISTISALEKSREELASQTRADRARKEQQENAEQVTRLIQERDVATKEATQLRELVSQFQLERSEDQEAEIFHRKKQALQESEEIKLLKEEIKRLNDECAVAQRDYAALLETHRQRAEEHETLRKVQEGMRAASKQDVESLRHDLKIAEKHAQDMEDIAREAERALKNNHASQQEMSYEIERLNQKFQQVSQEAKMAREEKEGYKNVQRLADQEMERARDELETTKHSCRLKEEEIQRLRKKLEVQKRESDEALLTQQQQARKRSALAAEQAAALKNRLLRSNDELNKLQAELSNTQQTFESMEESRQSELVRCQREMEHLKQLLEITQQGSATAQADLQALHKALHQSEQGGKKIQEELDAHKGYLQQSRRDVASLDVAIRQANSDREKMAQKVQELEGHAKSLQEEHDAVVSALMADLQQASVLQKTTEQEWATWTRQISENQTELQHDLKKQRAEVEEATEAWKKSMKGEKALRQQLKLLKEQLQSTIQTKEGAIRAREEAIADKIAALKAKDHAEAELAQRAKDMRQELRKALQDAERAHREAEEANDRAAEASAVAEIARAEVTLANQAAVLLREEVHRAQEETTSAREDASRVRREGEEKEESSRELLRNAQRQSQESLKEAEKLAIEIESVSKIARESEERAAEAERRLREYTQELQTRFQQFYSAYMMRAHIYPPAYPENTLLQDSSIYTRNGS